MAAIAMQADIAILRREQQRTRLEMAQLGQAAGVPISAEAPELQNMSSARPDKVSAHRRVKQTFTSCATAS